MSTRPTDMCTFGTSNHEKRRIKLFISIMHKNIGAPSIMSDRH